MANVVYTLLINGVHFFSQSAITVKHIKFTKVTDTNPRMTRQKVRLVNRKMPNPGASLTGYISDIATYYTLYEHLSEINSRNPANNTFTVTVDGTVKFSKNVLVADFQGDWDNEQKNKMEVTMTLQFKDAL